MTAGGADPIVIRRHLSALREGLMQLRKYPPLDARKLQGDTQLRWAVERGLQLCAQNVVDIAAHIAAAAGLEAKDYRGAVERLRELSVIPTDLYLEVDLNILARVLNEDLGDLDLFIEHVERYRVTLPG